MRKLAVGQSIVFCVPEEIETKIREVTETQDTGRPICVQDVLIWAIRGTWTDLSRSMPLWVTQGTTLAKQKVLWDRLMTVDETSYYNSDDENSATLGSPTAQEFLEDEAQSLEARYRPIDRTAISNTELNQEVDQEIMNRIKKRQNQFEGLNFTASTLQEEQERELAPEVEQETQIERPPPATAAQHHVDAAVKMFVRTGVLNRRSNAFRWALAETFKHTTAAKHFDINKFPCGLLVTKDYYRTIQPEVGGRPGLDNYQRSVQWVLTDRREDDSISTMIVLSPYEANKLMREIEASKFVVLHLFAPRHNKAFRPLDDLALYTIPQLPVSQVIPIRLRVELLLFSGQLYFESYTQYVDTCTFLCLAHTAAMGGSVVESDGFIDPTSHGPERDPTTILQESPVKFMKAVMTRIRRSCDSIEKTHMGRMLEGVLLDEDEIEEKEED